MNIYLIINCLHIKSKTYPYFYIGSDVKDRAEYMSSSISLNKDIDKLGKDNFKKLYIWTGTYNDLLKLGYIKLTELENYFHIKYDVVKNQKYYNRARAIGGFETTGTANVYYLSDMSKKIINLPANHADIISGKAVGMQTGNKFNISPLSLDNRKNTCIEKYGAYPASKASVVKNKLRVPKTDIAKQNMRKPKSDEHRKNMRKPKSDEHRKNMSLNHRNNTKVEKYNLLNQLLIIYDSIKSAAHDSYPNKSYNSARTIISNACRNNCQPKDFIWKYSPQK